MGAGTAADHVAATLLPTLSGAIEGTATSTTGVDESGVAMVISDVIGHGVGGGKHS